MFRRNKPGLVHQAGQDRARVAGGSSTVGRSEGASAGPGRQGDANRGSDGPAQREPFTYVHKGTVVVGEIIATGRVRVHGEIRGNVKVDGVLEIAESGMVTGETVEADVVKVLGTVTADVMASGKVEIWKGGVLTGNVSAPALDIEEGATFVGFSHMGRHSAEVERLEVRDVDGDEAAASGEVRERLAAGLGSGTLGRSGRAAAGGEEGDTPLTVAAEEA